ncbi:arylesterase [Ferrovibrio xuzhouensis]|uniref:Arylesterase n=1 Tax=Ferrovibrio xuzhouensis TaxID=1576914 RepID=A0ABV7VG88_9PROT
MFRRCRNAAFPLAVILVTLLAPLRAVPAQAAAIRLLAFGDSLTAGYNLPPDAAFPVQLENALKAKGLDISVINAGVSGDTTSAALSRVDWALADKPTHALVELGANDMLRGLSPEQAEANIDAIIVKLQQAGVKVMLAGMLAAPNLGADYGRRFDGMYARLAAKRHVPLYPFFLDGVAANPQLVLGDGMHPNREGVAVIVTHILPQILGFLGQ